MARVILIEATPWDNAATATNVYLAGGGRRGYTHRGRNSWKAGIADDPKFTGSIGFDESGWTGGSTAQTTKVRWFPSTKASLSAVAAYQWIKAPILVLAGDDAAAAPAWTTLVTGTVASIKITGGAIEFTIADLSIKLLDPFLTARFAGTGGIEGPAEAEGRIKRRAFGKVFNVEGLILDKANNIWEFGDPAFPINAFTAVRDKGRVASPAPATVAWQGSIAATFAALQASAPAAGSCVVAPSIACVKWWTQPAGPLTADLQGDVGAGYMNTVVTIAQRIVTGLGLGWTAPTAAVLAAPAGTAEAGIYVGDDSDTGASVLDRLLLGAGLVWIFDPAGSVQAREFTLANPVETLAIVDDVERVEAYRPNLSRRIAYQRSYRLHTDAEISAAVKTADIEGLGGLGTANSVAFNDGTIKQSGGVTTATDAAYQTGQGTSLAISNQAPAATDPTINPGATKNVPDRALNRNSSFQDGTVGWIAVHGSFSTSGSGNSVRGGSVANATPNAYIRGEQIPCKPGEDIYFAYRFATTTNRTGGGAAVWNMGVEFAPGVGQAQTSNGGPISIASYSVASGVQEGVAKITVPAGCYAVNARWSFDDGNAGSGALGYVDYAENFHDQPGSTVGADINGNVVDSGSATPTAIVPRNEIRTPLGTSIAIANQSWFATAPTLSLEDSTHLTNTTRISKLAAADGRVADPTILNTQLLLGPRSATDVVPSYTVGGSNVTVSLPSHSRTVAGASGKITITIGASSGVVAFSTYWAAYIDLATIANVPSPSVTFTTDPTDLLNSPDRLQLSSGIAPNAAGSGGSTTGGGGSGSLPRTGGGVYP